MATFAVRKAPLTLADMAPGRTDRVALIGMTGSGKSYLGAALLRELRKYVVVLDGKGTIGPRKSEWSDYKLIRTLDKLAAVDPVKFPRLIYRPPVEELLSGCEEFWDWVYRRRNTTALADELTTFVQGSMPPLGLLNCQTRGRELGIETWIGTQRPMQIPQIVLSEAEHIYCFRLQLPQDRKRIEEVYGIPAHRVHALKKRQFLYKREGDDQVHGPYTLRIKGQ